LITLGPFLISLNLFKCVINVLALLKVHLHVRYCCAFHLRFWTEPLKTHKFAFCCVFLSLNKFSELIFVLRCAFAIFLNVLAKVLKILKGKCCRSFLKDFLWKNSTQLFLRMFCECQFSKKLWKNNSSEVRIRILGAYSQHFIVFVTINCAQ
jgi:hypothetical protein